MKEIPPFPGTIEKRSRHKATLTPEQVRWCKKVYPHSTMAIMAQMMGISLRLTCEFFHQYGITKHKYRYKKLELNNWEKKIEIPKDIEQKATTQHSERSACAGT